MGYKHLKILNGGMGMASIVVAHYGIGDGDCGCFKRTRENLLHVLERMAAGGGISAIRIGAGEDGNFTYAVD